MGRALDVLDADQRIGAAAGGGSVARRATRQVHRHRGRGVVIGGRVALGPVGAAVNGVVAGPAVEDIVPGAAVQVVDAGAAGEGVVTGPAVEDQGAVGLGAAVDGDAVGRRDDACRTDGQGLSRSDVGIVQGQDMEGLIREEIDGFEIDDAR